jgi:hypothetical protein
LENAAELLKKNGGVQHWFFVNSPICADDGIQIGEVDDLFFYLTLILLRLSNSHMATM